MKKAFRFMLLTSMFYSQLSLNAFSVGGYEDPDDEREKRAVAMLINLKNDNDEFVRLHKESYFRDFLTTQNPRMTLVMCVDSRVHHHAFDKTPDNDIYTVRNLSGQYESNKGSIQYGVKHAHTPLLVVMGHDDCGAITAQTRLKWRELNPNENGVPTLEIDDKIQKELANVYLARASIPPAQGSDYNEQLERYRWIIHQNVKFNIHRQVDECLRSFYKEVKEGSLIIAGALYDFQGREEEGRGRLIWIDARDKDNVDMFVGLPQPGVGNVDLRQQGVIHYYEGHEVNSMPSDCDINQGIYERRKDRPVYRVHSQVNLGVERLKALMNKKSKPIKQEISELREKFNHLDIIIQNELSASHISISPESRDLETKHEEPVEENE